jgi:hypothetical protein
MFATFDIGAANGRVLGTVGRHFVVRSRRKFICHPRVNATIGEHSSGGRALTLKPRIGGHFQ